MKKREIYDYIILFMVVVLLLISCINLINQTEFNKKVIFIATICTFGLIAIKEKDIYKFFCNKTSIFVGIYIMIYLLSFISTGKSNIEGVLGYILGGTFFIGGVIIAKHSKGYTNKLLYALSIVITSITIFSIDIASVRLITTYAGMIINYIMKINIMTLTVVEQGARLRSIIVNPNIFASLTVIAIFILLYLYDNNGKAKKGIIFMLCANMMGFIWAFSLGGILSAGFAGLIYIIVNKNNNLKDKLYLVISLFLVSAVCAGAGFKFLVTNDFLISLLPFIFVSGAYFALRFILEIKERVLNKIRINKKIIIFGIPILIGAIIAIMNISKPMEFYKDDGERSISAMLGEGKHSIKLVFSSNVTPEVVIKTQTYEQATKRDYTNSEVFSPELESSEMIIPFTAPQGNSTIKVDINCFANTSLLKMEILKENGKTKNIILNRALIPGFIEKRLQSFSVNQNVLQRFVFFSDGLKIWQSSPVFGKGPRAFPRYAYSVQTTNYATDSSHNYFIDVMTETGLVGLVILVVIVIYAFILLIKQMIKEKDDLVATLFVIFIFMFVHSFIELTYIYVVYMAIFFMFLGIIASLYDKNTEKNYRGVVNTAMYMMLLLSIWILI